MAEPTPLRPDPRIDRASRLTPPNGIVPPVPSEAATARTDGVATTGRWHAVMTPLRKMMRRSPRH
jgi:hypothetical protein